jgi:hypothetical protein
LDTSLSLPYYACYNKTWRPRVNLLSDVAKKIDGTAPKRMMTGVLILQPLQGVSMRGVRDTTEEGMRTHRKPSSIIKASCREFST